MTGLVGEGLSAYPTALVLRRGSNWRGFRLARGGPRSRNLRRSRSRGFLPSSGTRPGRRGFGRRRGRVRPNAERAPGRGCDKARRPRRVRRQNVPRPFVGGRLRRRGSREIQIHDTDGVLAGLEHAAVRKGDAAREVLVANGPAVHQEREPRGTRTRALWAG